MGERLFSTGFTRMIRQIVANQDMDDGLLELLSISCENDEDDDGSRVLGSLMFE